LLIIAKVEKFKTVNEKCSAEDNTTCPQTQESETAVDQLYAQVDKKRETSAHERLGTSLTTTHPKVQSNCMLKCTRKVSVRSPLGGKSKQITPISSSVEWCRYRWKMTLLFK
jgi:hypothetical protein